MIIEIENGDFTHVFSNTTNETWEYIQRAVSLESKKYSNLAIGQDEKYSYANVVCYKGEPIEFFTMAGEGQFGPAALRCLTSQYTLEKYRNLKIETSRFGAMEETVNYYENIWPQLCAKYDTLLQYKLFFYTTSYGESNLETLFKNTLLHPEKWQWPTDKLYQIGRKEHKASAWKYASFSGDITLLDRPYLTTEEYLARFADQLYV